MYVDGSSGIQARLMRSADESELEGRVLIGLNGAWGAICYAGWGIQDANVVCRHLGYTSAVSASYDNVGGSWPGRVWLQDLRCKGDERTLLNCSHGGWGYDTKCRGRNKYRLARVVCSGEFWTMHIYILVVGRCYNTYSEWKLTIKNTFTYSEILHIYIANEL